MTAPSEQPSPVTLPLGGEIDLNTADQLLTRGRKLLTNCGPGIPLIIDLGAVTFMDSSGLSALVRLRRATEAKGTQLLLRDVPDRVSSVLRLTGMSEYFPTTE
ncbi:MAG TPA: STAS domain-containing protein [Jatrophihabitantaceae bacterium]